MTNICRFLDGRSRGIFLVLALLGGSRSVLLAAGAQQHLQECSGGDDGFTKTHLAAMDVPWLGMSFEFFRVQIEVESVGEGETAAPGRSLPLILVEGYLTRLPDFRELEGMNLADKTPAEQYRALSGGENPPYQLLRVQNEIEETVKREENRANGDEAEDSEDYYRGRRLDERERDLMEEKEDSRNIQEENPVNRGRNNQEENSVNRGRMLEEWLGPKEKEEETMKSFWFEGIDDNWVQEHEEDDVVRRLKRRFRLGRFHCRLLTDDLETESSFRAYSMVGTHRAVRGDEVSNGVDYWSDGTQAWKCLSRQKVENGVGFLAAWGAAPRLRVRTGHNWGTYLWCSR